MEVSSEDYRISYLGSGPLSVQKFVLLNHDSYCSPSYAKRQWRCRLYEFNEAHVLTGRIDGWLTRRMDIPVNCGVHSIALAFELHATRSFASRTYLNCCL